MLPSHPKLRWPLEINFEQAGTERVLLIRCPIGVSDEPLLLVPAVAPIISCFDGKMSVDEIHNKFAGYGLKRELIDELLGLLDKYLFLDGPKFAAAEQSMRKAFAASTAREAFLAGLSYPATTPELVAEIDGFLQHGNGIANKNNGKMIGLIAPHIDYGRGGITYGKAYNNLRQEDHDLYILIGTSHKYSDLMFHLTAKDFKSPLGILHSDKDFIEKLANRYGHQKSFSDEILHRREHSLELQIPFIRRIKDRPKIVPILVGSFFHMLHSGKLPNDFDEYESFAASLAECLQKRISDGQRICVIAGVDMAHIGRHFGDAGTLTPEKMEEIRSRDQIYLDAISARDKIKLFTHISEDNDGRRICGFPTMYTVLDVFERLNIKYTAQTFDYSQAVDYRTDCAVTFAGMGLYNNS